MEAVKRKNSSNFRRRTKGREGGDEDKLVRFRM